MVVEMKSSSEGVHSFKMETRYCFLVAEPIIERLANSWRELWAGSKARPGENDSGWRVGGRLSRGEGAGVGGDAIGTYRVDEPCAITVDAYSEL